MKLRHLIVSAIAGLALVTTGCDKKSETPAPAEAESAALTANDTPDEAAPSEAAPAAAAKAEGCHDKAADKEPGACAAHADKAEAGCGAHGEAHAGSNEGEGAAFAEPMHLGEAFSVTAESPLAQTLAAAVDGESTVRVRGTIAKVCQKKGCWMVIRDGDLEARVIMKDYGFVVPMNSAGQQASIEGTLKVRVFTEAQAKHLAEDGLEDPAAVTGERKEFLLTATAITIGG